MTPTTTADASMEREAFEAWAGPAGLFVCEFRDNHYSVTTTQTAWAAWQARAAISETNASTEREHKEHEGTCPLCWTEGMRFAETLCREEQELMRSAGSIDHYIAGNCASRIGLAALDDPQFAPKEVFGSESELQFREGSSERAAEPTHSFVQNVPDHCDRIIWRGQYHALPLVTPRTEAAAVVPDADYVLVLREQLREIERVLKVYAELPTNQYPGPPTTVLADMRAILAAAPSNVREQALEEVLRLAESDAARAVTDFPNLIVAEAVHATLQGLVLRIRALKSATPDAGKGEAT